MKNVLYAFILSFGFLACAQKEDTSIQDIDKDYEYEVVADNIEIPWGFDFFDDGSIIITEKSGQVFHHKNGETTSIGEIPNVYNRGQGGLLDVKIHPDYPNSPWIYFTQASNVGEEDGGHTALIRAKLQNGQISNIEELYKASPNTTKGVHFGSRLVFDREGYLYMSIG